MALTPAQKTAIEQVLDALTTATGAPRKRLLSSMFLDLVDREDWPEYFEVIPQPRCLNTIRTMLDKNRYKDPLEAYTDLSLVFWNAMFYNEPDSQIAMDAQTLKNLLDSEWKSKPLPTPRTSPPPSSAQKVHAEPAPKQPTPMPPPPQPAAAPTAPTAPAPIPSTSTVAYETKPPPAHIPPPPTPSSSSSDSEDWDPADDAPSFLTDAQIVRHLERGLPRYLPLLGADGGWMPDVKHERHLEIMQAIKAYRDPNNVKLSTALDAVPEDKLAISFRLLESRSRSKTFYTSSRAFDQDVSRMLESGRRYYLDRDTAVAGAGGDDWGKVVHLQRIAQTLTSPSAPTLTSNHPLTLPPPLPTPGAHPLPHVTYKGLLIAPGDYIHLSAAEEDPASTPASGGVGAGLGLGRPGKPLVARVVACWAEDAGDAGGEGEGEGERGVSVRWFLRAEEIAHLMPTGSGVVEGEVIHTDKQTHHHLPCIIERVSVQHIAHATRGRPRAPAWYPSWPVYVCRYRWDGLRGRVTRVSQAEWMRDSNSDLSATPEKELHLFERPLRLGRPTKKGPGQAVTMDRSVVSAAGQAVVGVEKLPVETTRNFARAPPGPLLWFPGPPMHQARLPAPRHSMEYLHFLAKKYEPGIKEPEEGEQGVVNGLNGGGDVEMPPAKRRRTTDGAEEGEEGEGEERYTSASERLRRVFLSVVGT